MKDMEAEGVGRVFHLMFYYSGIINIEWNDTQNQQKCSNI